jgi:hypothetical protein
MTSRRRKWIGLAAVMVAAAISAALWWNREPRYQGKALSEWADRGTDTYRTWKLRDYYESTNAIGNIGDEAIHWMIRWEKEKEFAIWEPSLVKLTGGRVTWLNRWVDRRMNDRNARRSRAYFIANTLKTRASQAIPSLLDGMETANHYSRRQVIDAISPTKINWTNMPGWNPK